MSIALKELLRQPRRFASVGGALTLLIVLLVVLGGFLDGLELSSTGAYRAHDGLVIVFDDEADRQLQRSSVSTELAGVVDGLDATDGVGSLDQVFTVAGLEGGELEDVSLYGYDLPTPVLPPPPAGGSAVVDAQLQRIIDVEVGDALLIGPTAEPFTVAAIVDDLTQGAPSVWVASDEWRRVVGLGNPAALPPPGAQHALVVRPAGGDDVSLAAELSAVDGIDPVTVTEAIEALDVVQQQSSTFEGIIGVTFVIVLLVVALFFALITLERVRLYAVLKALGARTGELLGGVAVQAIGVTLVALILGLGLSLAFVSLLPPDLPLRLVPSRLLQIGIGAIVTAVLGSLFTIRRLLRVDPAEVIG